MSGELSDQEDPLAVDLRVQQDPRELGALLRALRQRAGLTQTALGKRMGVVQNTVARIEAGKSPPTLATLTKFVRAAGYVARLELRPKTRRPRRPPDEP